MVKQKYMRPRKLESEETEMSINYWKSTVRNEKVFLAKEVCEVIDMKSSIQTLKYYGLEEGHDKITLKKKDAPSFFKDLYNKGMIGYRATSAVFLYESGIYKILIGSTKDKALNLYNLIFGNAPIVFKRYKEPHIIRNLKKAFNGFLKIEEQYCVKGFRIDGYIKEYNIAIECDENNHKGYCKAKEKNRTTVINKALNPHWIRFNPDNDESCVGKVVNRILKIVKNEQRY